MARLSATATSLRDTYDFGIEDRMAKEDAEIYRDKRDRRAGVGRLVGAVTVSPGRWRAVVLRRPLVFLVVRNDLRRFFGRSLVVFPLGKRADGHHAEHRYHQ